MLETLTKLHICIPASLRANSKDWSCSLCLPTPFVRKKYLGIIWCRKIGLQNTLISLLFPNPASCGCFPQSAFLLLFCFRLFERRLLMGVLSVFRFDLTAELDVQGRALSGEPQNVVDEQALGQ